MMAVLDHATFAQLKTVIQVAIILLFIDPPLENFNSLENSVLPPTSTLASWIMGYVNFFMRSHFPNDRFFDLAYSSIWVSKQLNAALLNISSLKPA